MMVRAELAPNMSRDMDTHSGGDDNSAPARDWTIPKEIVIWAFWAVDSRALIQKQHYLNRA